MRQHSVAIENLFLLILEKPKSDLWADSLQGMRILYESFHKAGIRSKTSRFTWIGVRQ